MAKRNRNRRRISQKRRRIRISKPAIALVLGATAIASILVAYRVVVNSDRFAYYETTFVGNVRATDEELARNLSEFRGTSLISLSLEQARDAIIAHPWVKDASLARSFPSSLEVTIEEHRPAYCVKIKDSMFLADSSGTIFKLANIDKGETSGLPVLSRANEFGAGKIEEAEIGLQIIELAELIEQYNANRGVLPAIDSIHSWGGGVSLWTRHPGVGIHVSRRLRQTAFSEAVEMVSVAWSNLPEEEKTEVSDIFVQGTNSPEKVVFSLGVGDKRGRNNG